MSGAITPLEFATQIKKTTRKIKSSYDHDNY